MLVAKCSYKILEVHVGQRKCMIINWPQHLYQRPWEARMAVPNYVNYSYAGLNEQPVYIWIILLWHVFVFLFLCCFFTIFNDLIVNTQAITVKELDTHSVFLKEWLMVISHKLFTLTTYPTLRYSKYIYGAYKFSNSTHYHLWFIFSLH